MPDLRILLTERPDLVLTIDDDFIGSAYSPQVEVVAIEGGHSVTITHKGPEGIEPDTFDVMDGATGPQGPDGYSPTVAITSTADEHTVTITDRQGPHSYSVPTYASEEAARDAAEQSREQAETSREAAWVTLSEQATTATQAANNAAQAASQAASDAIDAARAASQTATSVALAEQGRVQAEQARVTAEQGRATAEQARVSAETARATEWAEIKSDAQSAITAAEAATTAANDAAALATRAAASTWNAGNVLKGTLAESTVLTADDAWAAPPESVEVFGKSTQVSTTGKNLLPNDLNLYTKRVTPASASQYWTYAISVVAGTYEYSRDSAAALGFLAYWANDPDDSSTYTNGVTLTNVTSRSFTNDGTHPYIVFCIAGSTTRATLLNRNPQFEAGSSATTYEPYTGGKAAPSPDYPQEIVSVDGCVLNITGNPAMFLEQGGFDYDGRNNTANYKTRVRSHGYMPVTAGETLTIASELNNAYVSVSWYTTDENNPARTSYVDFATMPTILTVPTGASYARMLFKKGGSGTTNITTDELTDLTVQSSLHGTYSITSVQVLDQPLRSLPDGTRDTVTLSYIGPSTEHEGWGVYSKTLVQRVGVATINASEWQGQTPESIGDGWYRTVKGMLSGKESVQASTASQGMCTAAPFVYNTALKSEHVGTQGVYMLLVAQESTAAAIAARYDGATVIYKLKNPITHDLGTVELPILPNPLTAWADGGSAQPTLSMVYEQDINIVISELRSAIADMATS